MIEKEPVATASGATLVVAYLIGRWVPDMPEEIKWGIAVLIVAAIIAIARKFSFTRNTLREAGLNPAQVELDAKSKAVERNTEGEG